MNTIIKSKTSLPYNLALDVDSYKLSHWPQYPEGTDYSVLNTVYDCGKILYHTTLAECRERMKL